MTIRGCFPPLYPILDAALLRTSPGELAEEFADAGVRVMQYRNKSIGAGELFQIVRDALRRLDPTSTRWIVNDRPDVAALCGAGGVHVGQEDLPAEMARALCPAPAWVGVSTHNEQQFREAANTSADYIAVGPVYPTTTRERPDAEVGTEFIARMRRLTEKPIVAIGGITLDKADAVFRAGADCVAVARDLLDASQPARRARKFLEIAARVREAGAAGEQ